MIFSAWTNAAPHIILWSLELKSKRLAISSNDLLHRLANPFCCGLFCMVVFCRMLESKQYVLKCTESKSFVLSSLSLLGGFPHTANKFLQAVASASVFAFSNSTIKHFVYWHSNTKQNGNGDSDYKWSHHVCGYPLQLLLCIGFCHSWYWSLCDLRHCVRCTDLRDRHCLSCILGGIRLIQMAQSFVPLPCTVNFKFHPFGTRLEP